MDNSEHRLKLQIGIEGESTSVFGCQEREQIEAQAGALRAPGQGFGRFEQEAVATRGPLKGHEDNANGSGSKR